MDVMESVLSSFCLTCLSKERLLYPAHKLSSELDSLNLGLKIKETSGICWECRALIMKFVRFKAQVIEAQNTLSHIVKYENLESLSSMSQHTKYTYDLDIPYGELLVDVENDTKNLTLKVEKNGEVVAEETSDYELRITKYIKSIKQEENKTINIDINDTNISISDKSETDSERNEHEKKIISVATHDNFDDVKGKFETVVYKEEEMLRNREMKRNGPNFKKIPYKCDSCVLGFTRKQKYELHMKKKHVESAGEHICGVCQSRFSTGYILQRHTKKHYVIHRCLLCDYDSLQLWSVIAHCRTKHRGDSNGSIHCQQCDVVVSHWKKDSGDSNDGIHCQQCDVVDRSPEALAEHMRKNHLLHCNECGDKFKCRSSLRSHKIRVHGSKRDFICDTCGKTFKTKSRLESHIVRHSTALAKKLSYCTICKVQYKNIYVYRNHLQNSPNHSERTYECSECKKKFASKTYWRKHWEFYHLHKSQFKCDMCNKLFMTQWKLNNHRQIHHGMGRPRNHPCNVCGKKFFTLSMLRGHQLTHSEQRSYMCEDCGDTFKQRPALYTHTRLVHKGGKRK